MTTKKTHEVTQAYLKNWLSESEGVTGIWVFDIPRQKLRFSSGEKAFSFAAENYLYIPEIDGKKDQSAEEWLSSAEGELASFIRRIEQKDFATPISLQSVTKFLIGCLSLGYRSGYEIKTLTERLLTDEKLREHFKPKNENDAHLIVVENMINVITQQMKTYMAGSMGTLFDLKRPLMICDRPMFDSSINGSTMAYMPLTPQALLGLDLGNHGDSVAKYGPQFSQAGSNLTLVEQVNNLTVERARKWIVATTREQLEGVIPRLTLETVAARTKSDSIQFISPEQLRHAGWWKLKRDS